MTGASRQPALLSGFGLLRPVAIAACGYAVAAVAWLALGDALPGGRWFAVHLFTVGILSNLVVALSEHFARTLLRAGPPGQRLARFAALNLGALLMLAFPPGLRYPFLAGVVVMSGTVLWLAMDLRRMRRNAPHERFGFVVAGYERACVAFLAGAVLGGMLGTGLMPGPWYGAGRLAHMHVNILGWGGLTLLATMIFLGPAMMRTRIASGAEQWGRRALDLGSLGLALSVVGLVGTGAASPGPGWPHLIAAAGLLLYAVAGGMVAWPLLRAGRSARASTQTWMIQAAAVWFVVAVAADAVVIATGRLRLLDGLGAVLIVAVLGQAILAALNHLTPAVWGVGARGKAAVRTDSQAWGHVRVTALNLGALAILVAAIAGRGAGLPGTVVARAGWTVVALVVLVQVALVVRGARPSLAQALNEARRGGRAGPGARPDGSSS